MTRRGTRDIGFRLLCALTALVFPWALYKIADAPLELQMGIVYKIMFIHVPSAWSMYLGFTVNTIGSAVYLAKGSDDWEAAALAGAEVGLLFSSSVLVTGPLWASKAWGTLWTWDPRLTTTLLTAMIYVAYLLLRNLGGTGEIERRFAAGLGIMGGALMPIIHYSVELWRGQHPTVIGSKGGGLHPEMRAALLWTGLAFVCISSLLIWTRARAERARQRLQVLEVDAAERGLLGD